MDMTVTEKECDICEGSDFIDYRDRYKMISEIQKNVLELEHSFVECASDKQTAIDFLEEHPLDYFFNPVLYYFSQHNYELSVIPNFFFSHDTDFVVEPNHNIYGKQSSRLRAAVKFIVDKAGSNNNAFSCAIISKEVSRPIVISDSEKINIEEVEGNETTPEHVKISIPLGQIINAESRGASNAIEDIEGFIQKALEGVDGKKLDAIRRALKNIYADEEIVVENEKLVALLNTLLVFWVFHDNWKDLWYVPFHRSKAEGESRPLSVCLAFVCHEEGCVRWFSPFSAAMQYAFTSMAVDLPYVTKGKGKVKIFISLAKDDFHVGERLQYDLISMFPETVEVYLADECLEIGDNWKEKVKTEVNESHIILTFLSLHSLMSEHCVEEWKIITDHMQSHKDNENPPKVIPVRIRNYIRKSISKKLGKVNEMTEWLDSVKHLPTEDAKWLLSGVSVDEDVYRELKEKIRTEIRNRSLIAMESEAKAMQQRL